MTMPDSIQKLQTAVRRQPFEPFEVELPGEKRLLIDDPAAVAFRGEAVVFLDPRGGCLLWEGDSVRRVPPIPIPPRQPPSSTLVTLVIAHLVGICGSVIAATIEIETIVGTGPIFSILGLIVAAMGRHSPVRRISWWGASTLLLSLFVFALILIADWSPAAARQPVGILLLLYQAAAVPLGLSALRQLLMPATDARRAWQFDLRTLLGFTSLLAVILAAGRIGSNQGFSALAATAIAAFVGTLAALCYIGYRARRLAELRLPQRLGLASRSISRPDEPHVMAP